MPGQRIILCVTNDLEYDQRMQRICSSLAKAGYQPTLVGRLLPHSPPLSARPYTQVRLPCRFHKGKLFYLEYNYRLYRYLMQQPADALCAIDLDTILPVLWASRRKGIPRMYDAHEYFTEMVEVKRRPLVHYIWRRVEKYCVPRYPHGYTVGTAIRDILQKEYGVQYQLVRNIPVQGSPPLANAPVPEAVAHLLKQLDTSLEADMPWFLYQGALNEGRGLLQLVEAMEQVPARLLLCGSGNLEQEVKAAVASKGLQHKIIFAGNVSPQHLRYLTARCLAGITLFENTGLNQYLSLGNKFFDFIMAEKAQLCIYFPEYAAILQQYPVALPLYDTKPNMIAEGLNKLLTDRVLRTQLETEARAAAQVLHWGNEEKVLWQCWSNLMESLPVKKL